MKGRPTKARRILLNSRIECREQSYQRIVEIETIKWRKNGGMNSLDLLQLTDSGLFCAQGNFFVDPWQPVDRAAITHAHADHARPGSKSYLASQAGADLLRLRLGPEPAIEPLSYGETLDINGVQLSLHPAGHMLGSAQVRLEYRGQVWVVSGDYKTAADPTCQGFEPVRCHTFVTESTFGLPIYRWQTSEFIFAEINEWWQANAQAGRASVLLGYALGKAQRVLSGVDATIGPIFTHGAVEKANVVYRSRGLSLPPTAVATQQPKQTSWGTALIVAPPSARGTPWLRKFGNFSTALASGWMQIRGARRRRALDRGFPLSDHADWPGLLTSIEATRAERVLVTHGYTSVMVRWLAEQGVQAESVQTRFEGERLETADTAMAGEEGV
jgi:putative mRNA 3-end processing factor